VGFDDFNKQGRIMDLIKNIFYFIRSSIYMVYFTILSICLGLALPFAFLGNARAITDRVGRTWTWCVLFGLKYICGISWEFKGLKNLPKEQGFVIAGKHQSTFETYVMHRLFKKIPVFVLKKELLSVPIFGWSMRVASHVSIDRSKGIKALKIATTQGKEYLKEGHNVVIFPQGTRVPVGKTTEEYPYKAGVLALVRGFKCDVVPMALNSGQFWAKKQFLKKPGKIIVEFMRPIKYEEIAKMDKKEFMNRLESLIEEKSKKLLV
jgi:1-acyl-sn-glycerol-3-phosphate acyltransferase